MGELLLEATPARLEAAAAHFAEAIDVGERTLARVPSHDQVRRQVAIARRNLARAEALRRAAPTASAQRASSSP